MLLTENFFFIRDHNGEVIECRALTLDKREKFLEYWQRANQILREDEVAREHLYGGALPAIQFALDSQQEKFQEFRILIKRMLKLHKIKAKNIDSRQLAELLFSSGEDNGLLIQLEFSPTDVEATPHQSKISLRSTVTAQIAARSGNWYQALKAVEMMTHQQVLEIGQALREQYERAKAPGEKPKPDSMPADFYEQAEAAFQKAHQSNGAIIQANSPQEALKLGRSTKQDP